MPIKKANGKKDGLQKYLVRINYTDDNGDYDQLKRTVYGLEAAKDLERKLINEVKHKENQPTKKMTIQELFNEYYAAKSYEVRETTLDKNKRNFEYYILPTLKGIKIDKITAALVQDWKLSMKQRGLP